jgi:hypothetical protein
LKLALPDVTLIIVDGVEYARAKVALLHCTALCDFADAKILTHLPAEDHFRHQIKPIESIYDYSEFVIKELANYFTTSHVLMAQWDGFIWQTAMWSNEFLQYDYIGAPWPDKFLVKGIPRHFNVGNGGFSLRSRRLSLANFFIYCLEPCPTISNNTCFFEFSDGFFKIFTMRSTPLYFSIRPKNNTEFFFTLA